METDTSCVIVWHRHSVPSPRTVFSAGLTLVCVCSRWFTPDLLQGYCGNRARHSYSCGFSLGHFADCAWRRLLSSPHRRLIRLLFSRLSHSYVCSAYHPLESLTAEGCDERTIASEYISNSSSILWCNANSHFCLLSVKCFPNFQSVRTDKVYLRYLLLWSLFRKPLYHNHVVK